jgi:uncharacterized protein (DUF433 family)
MAFIALEPGRRTGRPHRRDVRMTVADIPGYLAIGMTYEQILEDFPYPTEQDILACLALLAARRFVA